MKLLVALVVVAILAVSLVSGTASAKGSLNITPGTVARGASLTLDGCGYPAPTSISFHVEGPGVNYFTAGEPLTSLDGCFSETWVAWWSNAGAYSITSFYRDSKGSLRKTGVVKFTVT
jgi:hypothetical protein